MVRHLLRAACGVVVVLALAACGRGEDDRTVPASSSQRPEPGACGGQFAEQAGAPLTLTGSFPERVRATERPKFEGTVTVANGTDRRFEGLSASQPDVYVTRAGEIVALPLPRDQVALTLDLAPGAARDFATAGSLRSCSGGRPLAPGRYELHVSHGALHGLLPARRLHRRLGRSGPGQP